LAGVNLSGVRTTSSNRIPDCEAEIARRKTMIENTNYPCTANNNLHDDDFGRKYRCENVNDCPFIKRSKENVLNEFETKYRKYCN
jgi:hypothetical protein